MLSPLRSALRGGSRRFSDTLKTRPWFEADFLKGYIHAGRSRDLDFQMIGVDRDLVEQVGGDDPPLPFVGLGPDLVDVEVGEMPGDVLEGLGGLVAFLKPLSGLGQVCLQDSQRHSPTTSAELPFFTGRPCGVVLQGCQGEPQRAMPLPLRNGASGEPGRVRLRGDIWP